MLYPEPGEDGAAIWPGRSAVCRRPTVLGPRRPTSSSPDRRAPATGVERVPDLRADAQRPRSSTRWGCPATSADAALGTGGARQRRPGPPLGAMVFAHRRSRRTSARRTLDSAASIGSSDRGGDRERPPSRGAAAGGDDVPASDASSPGRSESPGAEICVRYHPGRDGMDVGGDWYDVIDSAIADSGWWSATSAATDWSPQPHMGQFRWSFRSLLLSSTSPAEAFQVLNRMALRRARDHRSPSPMSSSTSAPGRARRGAAVTSRPWSRRPPVTCGGWSIADARAVRCSGSSTTSRSSPRRHAPDRRAAAALHRRAGRASGRADPGRAGPARGLLSPTDDRARGSL